MTHPVVADPTVRLGFFELYASRGCRLLPVYEVGPDGRCSCHDPDCKPQNWGKHPRVAQWQHAATTDRQQLQLWHAQWPLSNWAWAPDEDVFVVDCDPRNGGPEPQEWLAYWAERGLEAPPTWFQLSGGGGLHAAYHVCQVTPKGNDTLVGPDGLVLPGINVKGHGGYVLVSPSNHPSGRYYELVGQWTEPQYWPELDEYLARDARSRQNGDERHLRVVTAEEAGEGFDLERWYGEAPRVPCGAQRTHLLQGLGWLRARGRTELELITSGWATASRYVNHDPADPWTEHSVAEIVVDVAQRWQQEVPDVALPAWRPAVVPGGDTGGDLPPDQPTPPAGGARQRNTDLANAQELLGRFGGEVLWTPQAGWLCWDRRRWALDDLRRIDGYVARLAHDLWRAQDGAREEDREVLRARSHRLESSGGRGACLDYAQSLLARSLDEFDQRPWLLNCANGTLDLRDGQAREPAPGDLLTRQCPTEYDPEATSELLDEYLETFVPDPEAVEVLFRVLGATLVGGNPWRNVVLLVGPTTTGKSQLASALEATLGDYAGVGGASIFRGNLDDKPRPDLLKLLPCRLALLEEAGHAWELHADRVKAVTGGAKLSVRGMRTNAFVDRVPEFTPVIVANEPPRVKGSDDAIKQRLVVVRFEHSVAGREDVSKRGRFLWDPLVRRALLRLLVEGCQRAVERGVSASDLPVKFQLAALDVFEQLDDASEFVHWALEARKVAVNETVASSHFIQATELHRLYGRWLREHGTAEAWRDRLGLKQFNARLRQAGWTTVTSDGVRWFGLVALDPELSYRP